VESTGGICNKGMEHNDLEWGHVGIVTASPVMPLNSISIVPHTGRVAKDRVELDLSTVVD
jgi:hypothetical protein